MAERSVTATTRAVRELRVGDVIDDPEIRGLFRVHHLEAGAGPYRGKYWIYLNGVDGLRQAVLFRNSDDDVGIHPEVET